jgi:hypothetical protein
MKRGADRKVMRHFGRLAGECDYQVLIKIKMQGAEFDQTRNGGENRRHP